MNQKMKITDENIEKVVNGVLIKSFIEGLINIMGDDTNRFLFDYILKSVKIVFTNYSNRDFYFTVDDDEDMSANQYILYSKIIKFSTTVKNCFFDDFTGICSLYNKYLQSPTKNSSSTSKTNFSNDETLNGKEEDSPITTNQNIISYPSNKTNTVRNVKTENSSNATLKEDSVYFMEKYMNLSKSEIYSYFKFIEDNVKDMIDIFGEIK